MHMDETGSGVWRSVHGQGHFWGRLWGSIVTNGDFTAYVCYSAATRPSSQITLGRLVNTTANETDVQRKYYIYVILINLAISVLLSFFHS